MTSKEMIIKYNGEFINNSGGNMNCPRCGLTPLNPEIKSNPISIQLNVHICERCAKNESMKQSMKQADFSLEQWFAAK